MQLSLKEVLAKFPAEVTSRYDFSSAVYHGALERMTGVICREHGVFSQYPAQFRRNGSGCPSCGDVVRRAKRRLSQEEVIAQAVERHKGFYTYERAAYVNNKTKFTVTCPLHGDFQVAPNNHISGGKGCPVCGSAKRGHRLTSPKDVARRIADAKIEAHAARFAADARAVHGDLYDYSQVVYLGRKTAVTILCPKHGAFSQAPGHHLARAHGCPECSHHRSKGESALAAFMSVFARVEERNRRVIPPKELDIYVPEVGLAVEYCGEYWHGASSPEDERTARTRHLDKHNACAEAGVRLLTVYESEWLNRPFAIKRLIRNVLGKARGRVMARKCELRSVPNSEASAFFEKYHPQGGGGWGIHYGLFYSGKLVACMRFTYGVNDRGPNTDRVWTLTRYATRVAVAGGASRLLSAFIGEHNPDCIKSFSDNRYFTGEMYREIGFELEAESEPDYQVYHPKTGLLPKAAWQRRNIPSRIRDIGALEQFNPNTDHRSERDMTYLLGARRLFDCGKRRWVWRREQPASQAHDPVI